jgi:hypothetical protein
VKRRYVLLALAAVATLAMASPVFGLSSSLKKQIRKEIGKQLSKATGPVGAPGAPGAQGEPGTPGAQGLPGTKGTNGTDGVSGYELVSSGQITIQSLSANAFTLRSIQLCPQGKVAVGGGFSTLSTDATVAKFMLVQTSQRDASDPRTWQVAVRNTDPAVAHTLVLTVTAQCVTALP